MTDLKQGEPHPSAHGAFYYVKSTLVARPFLLEAIASCALSGNRQAEIVMGTIERMRNGEPVSDRYILGAAWCLMELEKENV